MDSAFAVPSRCGGNSAGIATVVGDRPSLSLVWSIARMVCAFGSGDDAACGIGLGWRGSR